MEINSPIRVSNDDNIKKISEITDRNFTSLWQILTRVISKVTALESKSFAEVVSVRDEYVVLRINNKNYKVKVEG